MHAHLLHHWKLPLVAAAIALEIGWYLLAQKRAYPWQDMVTSLGIWCMRLPVRLTAPLVLGPVAYWVWSYRLFTVPLDTAWGLTLLFLSEEFVYYWSHRAGHEVRWMWASHVVHHSPDHIHLASALRLGVTEIFSGNWLFRVPLYLLGFNPLAVAAVTSINLVYQFWLHTDLVGRLGPLEWIFNTPSHHRVHHASNPEYIDRNYGGILIVWDRLFGTVAQEQPQTTITYGLVHPIPSRNPMRIAFHEWGALLGDVYRAQSWAERLRQSFGRPGGVGAATLPAIAVVE